MAAEFYAEIYMVKAFARDPGFTQVTQAVGRRSHVDKIDLSVLALKAELWGSSGHEISRIRTAGSSLRYDLRGQGIR